MGHNIPDRHIPVKPIYSFPELANSDATYYSDGMENLRLIRKARGLNQTQLAEIAGVEQSTVSKVETGWDGVTLRNLRKLAQALDVQLVELFTDGDAAAALILLDGYRSLTPGQKEGWQQMALAAKSGSQKEDS